MRRKKIFRLLAVLLSVFMAVTMCIPTYSFAKDEKTTLDGTAVAAEPLTREEYDARGGDITEQERIASINYYFKKANPEEDIPTILHLEEGASIKNGQLLLKQMSFEVKSPDGKDSQTVPVDVTGSYLNVADDVVLIGEKDENWFSENGTLTIDGVGSSRYNNAELKEDTPVLILETDGVLRGYYAAAGSNSNTLVLGSKMNVYRGITTGHLETPKVGTDIGPKIPLPPVTAFWGDNKESYFKTDMSGAWAYLHFDVDVDLAWILLGAVSMELHDNSLELEYDNNEVHVEDELEEAYNIPLCTIEYSLAEVISFAAAVNLSFEGTGTGTTKFSASIHEGVHVNISYSPWDGLDISNAGIINDQIFDIDDTDMKGEFYMAYGEGPEVRFFEVIGIGASYKGGCVIEGETSKNHEYPGEPDVWHACDDEDCICGNAHIRFGPLSVDGLVFNWSTPIPGAHTDPTDLDPFKDYYVSRTFNDKNMDGKCPHKGYKINTEVQDTRGKKIEGATVSYTAVPDHFQPVSSGETDKDGKTTLYAPTGDYNVTAEVVSPHDHTAKISQTLPITKDTTIQSLTFNLDVPVKHVYFKNSGSGDAKDWPADMEFQPFFSEIVKIPDKLPSMSGRQFVGWNTKEDGSGTSYAPGTTITAKDDVTLWAQWKIDEKSWYVIYNANGGTKAPGPEIVQKDKDAVLSKELPEAGRMIFKGWTTDPKKPKVEYQPGDTLPYDSSKNVVVLYAVWDLSPVPKPINVSFDANGVDKAELPADLWFEQGTWATLAPAIPPLNGSYVFVGWSEDPKATVPEFKAGKSYRFYKTVKLYAIWKEQKKVTLTFADSLSDEVSNMPDPITIQTNVSPNVKIPDTIPKKPGRKFVGWNTKKDRTGTTYLPGDTIVLKEDTTLWAQWVLDPVDRPVVISFEANGGLKESVPDNVSAPKNEKFQLPDTKPAWDGQHDFLGWSTDYQATEPTWKAGDTVSFNEDTTLYAIWNAHYKVIEGANATWTKASGKMMRFAADGNLEYFKELKVDGKLLTDGVKISSGSTVADISSAAMEKLSVGDHTITFVYKDGEASAKFSVAAHRNTPKTGDTENPVLLIVMIIISLMGMIGIILIKRRGLKL